MSWNQATADKLAKATGREVRAFVEIESGWLVWFKGEDGNAVGHLVLWTEVEDA